MTEREALKLALEALHGFIPYLPLNDEAQCGRYDKAITAIKEALAQPEPEYVAFMDVPQRTWVGLTDEEIQYCVELKNPEAIAEEVEAKLKEKNR